MERWNIGTLELLSSQDPPQQVQTPSQIPGPEEIQVVQQVVELINLESLLCSGLERPGFPISIVESPAKASEELTHSQLGFTVTVVRSRIDEDSTAPFVDQEVPAPEIPVE